ncbi:toll/interleukin-1 receptor domain-containing protein [Fructilactobacillus myrtifloralis]|uniref:Toll/interleukin-1 receptor domain-containing protein n=1 Tax=Fructilactobacillus myrtifloralis TaxID=2940301 RepID=A0ABY5BM99_9LACO|nr:toll/interleukin-1 receptor domain-containing protein [Fructilactobacillus myrtifloralis]USS84808.1 toll/interleukin-1 receptor domain-containing protein [Fructilactobacillus myrtifloralis]
MILNKQFLYGIANDPRNEVQKNLGRAFGNSSSYDLFISHSFKDKNLIGALASLFEKDGISVYIDWIQDSTLDRLNVTSRTANVIKNRIKQCTGLAYIATKNIVDSKWCPWELGIGDGMNNGKVCILPILETKSDTFHGQEYLGLYQYIDYSSAGSYGGSHFWINDPQDGEKIVTLKEWLRGNGH